MLYDAKGRVALYVGLYRTPGQRAYTLADDARLFDMQPLLRRWLRFAKAQGFEPLGTGSLLTAVEALGVPALVARRGTVLFGNELSRASPFDKKASELRALVAASPRIPVRTKHDAVDIVVLPRVAAQPSKVGFRVAVAHLPPYLAPVAQLLRDGLSYKEIAIRAATSLATVRTYVQRVLKRLGLQDRRALMRLPS